MSRTPKRPGVSVTREVYARLRRAADARGMSVPELLDRVIERGLLAVPPVE